jgi:hypothetical protein
MSETNYFTGHLRPGCTRFCGVVMNGLEAEHFRGLQRRIRRHIAQGHERKASFWFDQCRRSAGDNPDRLLVCEHIRQDAARRWLDFWGKAHGDFGTPECRITPAKRA